MERTERQKLAIKKWIQNKGIGACVWPTGGGKTRIALMLIKLLQKKNYRTLVVVPTEQLKNQWNDQLVEWNLSLTTDVVIINTGVKHKYVCDLLIIDELHRAAASTLRYIFQTVTYKHILGLTATYERLDGGEELIARYCPVIDTLSIDEALKNGWIAPYKEYMVLINAPNIEEYKVANKSFIDHFAFFNYDFNLAMSCIGPNGWKAKLLLRDKLCNNSAKKDETLRLINMHSIQFMRCLQLRKSFINNHPKKIELARKIIAAYPDKKIITFSNSIKMAEAIQNGKNVYAGPKTTKKKGRIIIDEFNKQSSGVINSVAKLLEGADLKGLSIGIRLGIDSSGIKATQSLGRIIRAEEGKQAIMFNLIINNTVECSWFDKSHKGKKYTIIDEDGLNDVLNNKEPPIRTFGRQFSRF